MDSIPFVSLEGLLITGLVTAILTAVGALLIVIGWINHRRAQASLAWPWVLGSVLGSQVASHQSSEGGTTYSPHVSYTYGVDGRDFHNDRLAFGGLVQTSNYQSAERAAARYVPGSHVQVYYNAQNPQDAVLERRSGSTRFLVIFGGFFVFLSCGLFGCVTAAYVARLVG